MSLMQAIVAKTAHVGIIGLGYVGLPLAATTARKGFPVTGFDVDPRKIDQIAAGTSYIDAVTDDALAQAKYAGGLSATADFTQLRACDVIIICLPTPLDKQNTPDLSYVIETTHVIARHITPDTLVVLESTTYPGTTSEVLHPILATSGLDSDAAPGRCRRCPILRYERSLTRHPRRRSVRDRAVQSRSPRIHRPRTAKAQGSQLRLSGRPPNICASLVRRKSQCRCPSSVYPLKRCAPNSM